MRNRLSVCIERQHRAIVAHRHKLLLEGVTVYEVQAAKGKSAYRAAGKSRNDVGIAYGDLQRLRSTLPQGTRVRLVNVSTSHVLRRITL